MNPEFVLFTGPMFGGKTTKMLASLERAKHQKRSIALFKPKKDHRYALDQVVSHNGIAWQAISVSKGPDIISLAEGCDIVAVDEAFMITGCADALITLFKSGKSVYVSTIQISSLGNPFKEVMLLFPWATKVEICPAVCPICGQDAYYTIAKNNVANIQVGGSETYEPRCFTHNND